MELSYEELEQCTGTVFEVLVSIYEDAEPWVEEGAFFQAFYDDEQEARDSYAAQCSREDLARFLFEDYSDVPEYDTVGVFLLERPVVSGRFADTYFSDDIIEMRTFSR